MRLSKGILHVTGGAKHDKALREPTLTSGAAPLTRAPLCGWGVFGVPYLAWSPSNRNGSFQGTVSQSRDRSYCVPANLKDLRHPSWWPHRRIKETGVFCKISALEHPMWLGAEDSFGMWHVGARAGVPSSTLSRFARLNFMCSCTRPTTEPQTREAPLQIPSGSVPEVHAISHCDPLMLSHDRFVARFRRRGLPVTSVTGRR